MEAPLRGPSNNYHNPFCCRDKDINTMCVSVCVCVIYLFIDLLTIYLSIKIYFFKCAFEMAFLIL